MRRFLAITFLLLAPVSLLAQVTGRGYSGASPNSNSGNIGVGCRTVTGSSDSGGIVTTDRAACIEYTATGAVSETLPQAGTAGFGFNFPVKLISAPSSGSQTVTVTITTSTATVVNGYSVALSQTSFQLTTGQFASVNSPDNTNYFVTITTGGSGGSGCTFSGGAQYDLITAAASGGPCTPANVQVDPTLNSVIYPNPSGISYGTVTSGNLACYVSTQKIGNCTSFPASNFIGVFVNSAGGYATSGWHPVNLDATVTVTVGDYICSSTSADQGHDNGSSGCPLGQLVGLVYQTQTSVSVANVWLTVQASLVSTATIGTGGSCGSATLSICSANPISLGSNNSLVETWTVGTGGVTANKLVQTDTSNPSKIIAASTAVYGVALATVSAAGTADIARYGTVPCVTDTGGATAGDLVIIGSATVTDCKDSGQTSSGAISQSTRIVGVFRSTASAGSTALVELTPSHFGTLVAGSNMANNTVTATQLAAQYSKGQCTELWGGSGTSFALTSGDDAIADNSCYNDSGVTRTITAVKCRSDIASNTTTVNPVFGASGSGTTIGNGTALTCGSSLAYSATITLTNTAWTTGTGINPVMGGTLTGTSIAMLVEYTF